MRGLRLFVRPIDASDHAAVEEFLRREERPSGVPAWGLLGKLLGDIVAVVFLELEHDVVRVAEIVVARELRRKWIGRVMMREVEQLAVKLERQRIVVEDARDAEEFFRRVGFESQGERWVRAVPS
jgi:N-acetylglutamate synthase-like GNAT family acetyltransferase